MPARGSDTTGVFLRPDIRNQLAALLLTAEGAQAMGASQDYATGFKAALIIVAQSFGVAPYELERR